MKIAQEEIFGPVLSVLPFKNADEAIQIANDTTYGLAASLWTNDINKAHKIAKALRAGVVSVNTVDTGDITVTFGGYKQSGIGREGSLLGLENYTEVKTTWIELS
jgi:acyl-CoA reductase-like NAD-dependent aldehyde dehydrogenase